MTGAEVQAAWFSPFHFFVYLFAIFVLTMAYSQWKWTKKCDKFLKVLVVHSDGSTGTEYAPKEGSSVAITNPKTGMTRLWPLTEVTTIEMLYPGDGFIPVFLQKKIRTTIVDSEDWEPMLNRGAYTTGVASPDVKAVLAMIAESLPDGEAKDRLRILSTELRTAPTREMIASPAILGNIGKEKVSELAVTVAKDIMNPLQEALKKLGQQVKPTILYIGLGLVIALLVYTVYQLTQVTSIDMSAVGNDINQIKQALGVK